MSQPSAIRGRTAAAGGVSSRSRSHAAGTLTGAFALLVAAALLLPASVSAATFTVENTDNAGAGSLREAITGANANPGGAPHLIDATGVSGVINLESVLPNLSVSLTIAGPGADQLTVRRDDAAAANFRIFTVLGGVTAELSGLTIADGVADGTIGPGAGISVLSNATLRLLDSAVSGNETTGALGGAGINNAGDLRVENSTVSDNTAAGDTGGIENVGEAVVLNSTVSGNRTAASNSAGGIRSTVGGELTLENSTVAANAAAAGPDAAGNLRVGFNGTASLSSSILAHADGDSNCSVAAGGALTSQGYNLADDNTCELDDPTTDQPDTDPELDPLANNGGPTETMALPVTSPAIDQGTSDDLSADQRGLTRPVDFAEIANAPGGDGSDIGAFERQEPLALTVTTLANEGPGSLRSAIELANAAVEPAVIDASGVGGVIDLDSPLDALSADVTIEGPGADQLSVRRDEDAPFLIFEVLSGVSAGISGLTLSNGLPDPLDFVGGIRNNGTLELRDSAVSDNQGTGIMNGGTLVIVNSTISNNTAPPGLSVGGAIDSFGPLTVRNSTITANQAADEFGAGGIWTGGGAALSVESTTIAANMNADGVANLRVQGLSTTAELRSTIIAQPLGGGPNCDGPGIASQGYNLDDDDTCDLDDFTTDQPDTAPELAPPADNGGPTETMALSPTSPAIDQGVANGLTTDQRGFERPVVFDAIPNAAGGDGSDIGAFELQEATFTVENTNDDGVGSLRRAIIGANAVPGLSFIEFAPGVSGTIELLSALPALGEDVEIEGPGAEILSVSRDAAASSEFRIFTVLAGVSAEISGLMISDGVEPSANGGGGIRVASDATLRLRESVVRGNKATGDFGNGGGIRNLGELRIENSTVSENEAAESGGGGIGNTGTLELVSSTVSGNEAGNFGGGISSFGDGTVEVVSSTLSENVGRAGGPGSAIHSSGDTLTVTNSTIAANAPVALRIGSGGTASLRSTIISGSSPSCWPFGTMPDSEGYNLADDDSCELTEPTDREDIDPQLAPLADNGGPTETMALSPTSPAIDQGLANGLSTDQRGLERPVVFDDIPNAAGGDGSDIGAFEVQVEEFLVLSVDPASLAFGDQVVGTESAVQAVEVENAGTAPVTIGTLGIEGSDPDDFSVGPDGCSDELLQPAETCVAQARFTPASSGAKQAQVVIPSNAPDSPNTVALSGTGTAAPSPPPPPPSPPSDDPPPPPPSGDPAPPPPADEATGLPAKLQINRAQVRNRRLTVRGSLDPRAAAERVAVRFRTAGRQIALRPTVQPDGRFGVNRRLRGPQRRARAGRLVVRFQGNATLRAASAQLRAARRAVRLRIVRAGVEAQRNRLALAGRVLPRARRGVRIEVKFNRPDGSSAQVTGRARPNARGRFRSRLRVPPAVRNRGAWVSITHPGRARLFGQRRGRGVGG